MRPFTVLAIGACLALVASAAHQTWPRWAWELRPPSPDVAFASAVKPFVNQTCYECHDDATRRGKFSLENLAAPDSLVSHRETWERVLQHVKLGLMPPPDTPPPAPAARASFVRWLDHALHPIDPAHPDPGRVVTRRLSRIEYANTIRDVLGVDFDPSGDFPEDDTGYGFDHIGDVLSTSPLLFERLLAAAVTISEVAITDPAIEPRTWDLPPAHWIPKRPGFSDGGRLWSNGTLTRTFNAPAEGRYRLVLSLAQDPRPGPDPARAELRLAGVVAGVFDATGSLKRPHVHTLDLRLARGPQALALAFINDYYREGDATRKTEDRNLHFVGLQIEGPFEPSPVPPSATHLGLLGAAPAPGEPEGPWIHAALGKLARPLFRREVTPAEIARLAKLVEVTRTGGGTREAGLQVALQAMLVSPSFLYRNEPSTRPMPPGRAAAPDSPDAPSAVPITDQALATRLGYFLWAGPPDTRLLDLARDRQLRPQLATEVNRLLADPRAERFLKNFAGQWLLTRNIRLRTPDAGLFPDWTPGLASSLEQEVLRFVGDFLTNGRPVTALLSSGETFMNAQLAAHYGLPPPSADHPDAFVRTPLPPGRRAGLLGLPGILAVSSYPNRTSPVLRGKFVLEQLLGTPPPPPPPNIPSLTENTHADGTPQTLRQRLEQHRAAPSCAACHAFIDPLGFSLEGFAADGRSRQSEGGQPLDTEGRLDTGETVRSAEDLAAVLVATRADAFRRQLASQLLVFALGRGTDYYDRPALDRIIADAREAGDTLPAYLHAITRSFPFLNQRSANAPQPKPTPPPPVTDATLARL